MRRKSFQRGMLNWWGLRKRRGFKGFGGRGDYQVENSIEVAVCETLGWDQIWASETVMRKTRRWLGKAETSHETWSFLGDALTAYMCLSPSPV